MEVSGLPRLFHIGTQKAGSSFLYNVLQQHSDISLSEYSEVQFYNKHYARGRDWYVSTYKKKDRRIDISPKYFMMGDVVAPRIKEVVGGSDPRFVIILRNPIDYLNSHFQLQKLNGFFDHWKEKYPNFTPDLVEFVTRYPEYTERAMYHNIFTNNWLSHFDRSQFLVLFFEDVIRKKQESLDKILSFWGAPSYSFDFENVSRNPMLRNSFLHRLKRKVARRPRLKRMLKNSSLFHFVYSNFLTESSSDTLSDTDRVHLKKLFDEDVEQMESMLGEKIRVWRDFE